MSEFISNHTETFKEILPHQTPSVKVHIKQYWHFRRATTKQYYIYFSELKSHNTFSGSLYKMRFSQSSHQTILTPPEVLPNNAVKWYLSMSFYLTRLKFAVSYYQIPDFFHKRCIRQCFFLSKMWTYSKSFLTVISAKVLSEKFIFKNLTII